MLNRRQRPRIDREIVPIPIRLPVRYDEWLLVAAGAFEMADLHREIITMEPAELRHAVDFRGRPGRRERKILGVLHQTRARLVREHGRRFTWPGLRNQLRASRG